MSVSAGDNSDIGAAVDGGAGFAQRLEELRLAKAAYDKSLNDLNLGKAAEAANTEAGRILSAAKDKRDADMAALDAEVSKARADLNSWVEEIKTKTTADYEEANRILAEAKSIADAAMASNSTANRYLTETKAKADTILSDAQAAADEIVASATKAADKLRADAKTIELEARKTLEEAQASKAKYEAAINSIKSAASHIDG